MTISIADTAELPQVREPVVSPGPIGLFAPPTLAPPARPAPPEMPPVAVPPAEPVAVPAGEAPVADRVALRAERLRARRERRRWALFGLCVMAATLGATVAVLVLAR